MLRFANQEGRTNETCRMHAKEDNAYVGNAEGNKSLERPS
jgi:hypothetical protein